LNPALVGSSLTSRERERADGAGIKNRSLTSRLVKGDEPWEGKLRFTRPLCQNVQSWHETSRDGPSAGSFVGHRIPVWGKGRISSGSFERTTLPAAPVQWEKDGRIAYRERPISDAAVSDPTAAFGFVCVRDPGDKEVVEAIEHDSPFCLRTPTSSTLALLRALASQHAELARRLARPAHLDPSNVLCTAAEIITLWVSRMVILQLYFRGCLPFKDVFIHAMIQDGEGQKMSQEPGQRRGPAATSSTPTGPTRCRYILTAMTTQTQDLRMPVDLVDPHSGQAFAPVKITTPAGTSWRPPIQSSPKDRARR